MNINDRDIDVEAQLQYLGETDNHYAKCKAWFLYATQNLKVKRSLAFLAVEKGSIADRTAIAETSESYRAALADYRDASYELERVRAKRNTAQLSIEVWRSQESSKRALIV